MDYSALLTRPEWTFNETLIDEHLAGKRVLITGAGGSIGSAVARRVAKAGVEFLGLVDVSENAMFNFLQAGKIPVKHQVSVSEACSEQIENWYPDIIIHAAAYKHVGLMNSCPGSAYRNNVLATQRFARRAKELGVGQFLFVSTDKAVNPSNYMGASKRLAEAWLLTHLRDSVKVCRFGNVLGSSGSLVEIVTKQLNAGLPVTITDPSMTRYFITPDEAVGLLLTSLTFDGCGPFTIDMGESVSVMKLVRRIADVLDKFLEIEISSAGVGEKINEELINPGERASSTLHPGIFSLDSPSFRNVSNLINAVGTRHIDMIEATRKMEVGSEDMYQL